MVRRGTLYQGTSGFAYPDWVPTFYAPGTPRDRLLEAYARRLPSCELSNTYYQQPTEARVAAWLEQTPADFRFAVKVHRNGSRRAYRSDPATTLEWLARPFSAFGDRLGTVLFRIPREEERDIGRLGDLLTAWPRALPLTIEFQHPSWIEDSVLDLMRRANAALCCTDLSDEPLPPPLYATGPFLYLRLRRDGYTASDLDEWAARIDPFLADGRDAYVFFRHDPSGGAARMAEEFATRFGP